MGRLIEEYTVIKLQQEYVSKTIDTLWKMAQKYLEIEQIFDNYCDLEAGEILEKVKEVVEDGDDD